MESLNFTLEGRDLPLTDDVEFLLDSLTRSRNLIKGWNADSFPVPLSDIFQGMESMESGLLDIPRKSAIVSTQHLVDDANCGSGKSSTSVPTITPDASVAIGSRFSNLAVETSPEKLVQASLEIMECNQFSVENSLFSQDLAMSAKRVRIEKFPAQIPVCLVHGCNKDLSSLKDYHRKHKVCDIHSKTSAVIVNGARQRFCQQCSRFHILAEFDEGKRSCRKRLADHNERRRKPQLDTRFGKLDQHPKFLESKKKMRVNLKLLGLSQKVMYAIRFAGSMLFNRDFFGWQCTEPNSHIRPLKLQNETTPISKSVALQAFEPWQYPLETNLNSPPLAGELSGSRTSCARTLLSTQSQSLLSNSEIPALANHKAGQPSAKITPAYSEARIPDANVSLSFENSRNEPEGATANTVDLLQLSLHLQRVQEQQKTSAPENVFS